VKGDIEEMPFEKEQFDVIISNCVLNLVPDKAKAFGEMFRVLKHGGHFCISDVVLIGELPQKLQENAEMYAGCIAGALQKNIYLQLIIEAGFQNIEVHRQRLIEIPVGLLSSYLDSEELQNYLSAEKGIFSITVSGYKF
jgi:SAM-dependent methyltransferase